MKMMVIANPASFGGRFRDTISRIQRLLKERGVSYRFFLSQHPGYGEELARKAKEDGFEVVVACGGDGTVHEIVNGIIGTGVILGIIPIGRGKDLARNLGIDKDIVTSVDNIGKGRLRSVDAVRVNEDRYYLGVSGVGFDSEVNRWVNEKPGFFRCRAVYAMASLARMPGFKHKRVRIVFDEAHFDGDIFLAAFGNTRSYGGGMYITPNAEMDDGLLDICLIDRMNKLKLLYLFPTVFKGTHLQIPGVRSYRSRRLSVESDTALDLYGDGEFICKTPFSLEVIPKALRVIIPSDSRI